jgi:hypothetical protein
MRQALVKWQFVIGWELGKRYLGEGGVSSNKPSTAAAGCGSLKTYATANIAQLENREFSFELVKRFHERLVASGPRQCRIIVPRSPFSCPGSTRPLELHTRSRCTRLRLGWRVCKCRALELAWPASFE